MSEASCRQCEELLELYLDGELAQAEVSETEEHLDLCGHCRRHYRFESLLRAFIWQAMSEPMPPELSSKLASLRSKGQ